MNGRVAGIKPPNNNEGHYVSMRRPAFGRDIVLVPGDYTDIDVNMDGSDPCASELHLSHQMRMTGENPNHKIELRHHVRPKVVHKCK